MTVAEAAKLTELGPVPFDWEVSTVGKVVHIATGSRNTQDKVEDGEYPFFVRSQTVERINSFSYEGEAVLTAGDGVGTGKIFHYINGRFDCHQRVYRLSGFDDQMDGYFFFKFFSAAFYNRIMSMTAKSSVDSVRREMIADMAVPVPAIQEQKAIAGALKDIDDLIDSLDALIAKKREIKQAAMQQLLTGNTRLPGFAGEWGTFALGSLCSMKSGVGITSKDISEAGQFPVYGANGIRGFTSHKTHGGTFPLIGRVGALCGNIQIARGDFFASEHAIVAEPRGKVDPEWLALVLSRLGLNRLSEASAQPVLTVGKLGVLRVYGPSDPEEQREISGVISAMDAELSQLARKRAKTVKLREAMMQQLLTGRIRLI